MSMYSYCMFMYLHRTSWHSSATLRVFRTFSLSCKANARVKFRKHGARTALFQNFCVVLRIVCFVSFCVLLVCKCVLNYCHRVATQLRFNKHAYIIKQTPYKIDESELTSPRHWTRCGPTHRQSLTFKLVGQAYDRPKRLTSR
jgi:hypothetical protein